MQVVAFFAGVEPDTTAEADFRPNGTRRVMCAVFFISTNRAPKQRHTKTGVADSSEPVSATRASGKHRAHKHGVFPVYVKAGVSFIPAR